MILAGCDSRISEPAEEGEVLGFSYFTNSQYEAARAAKENSTVQSLPGVLSYGCYVSVYQPGSATPWKYWSIVLDYPKGIAKKAAGRKVKVKVRINTSNGKYIARLANCIIPNTSKAVQMLRKLMLKNAENIRRVSPDDRIKPAAGNNDTISSCIIVQNGYWCPDGYCFVENRSYCEDPNDPNAMFKFPELLVEGDDEGGGGGPEPPPGPYSPPAPGDDGGDDPGGGGPCYSCDPGGSGTDNPCAPSESGGIPIGCEEEEPEPCETDNDFIDDESVQQRFREMFAASNFGSLNNPNDQNQRREVGGLGYSQGQGYVLDQFTQQNGMLNGETPYTLDFNLPADSEILDGSIFVHVHPFYDRELQYIDNKVLRYESGEIPERDRILFLKIFDHYEHIDHAVIIDANKITFVDQNLDKTIFDRCGY